MSGERVDGAADVSEPESPPKQRVFWTELVEIVEVIVLALVAIATAWSGYQAAKWDSRQSLLYGTASTDRFEADAASTAGGQELVANASLFTAWLQATEAHDSTLAALYVRRFTPDYRAAFQAWLRTGPLTNPDAPAGPAYMPQYRNPNLAAASQLNNRAAAAFAQGNTARDNSDDYVRDTVLFAAVLFLVAIAQRFKLRNIRVATTTVALVLLVYAAVSVVQLPGRNTGARRAHMASGGWRRVSADTCGAGSPR
jgi:hypothetical protein